MSSRLGGSTSISATIAPSPAIAGQRRQLVVLRAGQMQIARRRGSRPARPRAIVGGIAVRAVTCSADRQGGAAAQIGQRAVGHQHARPTGSRCGRCAPRPRSARATTAGSPHPRPPARRAARRNRGATPGRGPRSARPAPEAAAGRSAPAPARRAGACPWNRCRCGGRAASCQADPVQKRQRQRRAFAAQPQIMARSVPARSAPGERPRFPADRPPARRAAADPGAAPQTVDRRRRRTGSGQG